MTNKTCFIISPIGEQSSETRKRSDSILKYVIDPAAYESGYETIRADQISEPGMITSKIINHIVNDPLVIADLTGHNPNVFYELAIRHAIKKPLIQIMKKGEKIPFDIAGMKTIFVDHHDLGSAEDAKKEIIAQIKALEKDPSISESPISIALDLQSLKTSDSIEQRSLADIMTMMTELSSSITDLTVEQKGWIRKDYPDLASKYTEINEKYQSLKYKSLIDPKIYKNFEHVIPVLEEKLTELVHDTGFQSSPLKIRVLGVCFHKSFPFIKNFIEENCVSGKRIEIRLSLLDRSYSKLNVLV